VISTKRTRGVLEVYMSFNLYEFEECPVCLFFEVGGIYVW